MMSRPLVGGPAPAKHQPALEAVALIIHRLRVYLEAENQLNPSPVSTAGLRDALAKLDALPPTDGRTSSEGGQR